MVLKIRYKLNFLCTNLAAVPICINTYSQTYVNIVHLKNKPKVNFDLCQSTTPAPLPRSYLIHESVSEVAYSETKISCEMLRNLSLFQKNIKGTSKKQIRRASILRQHIKEITTMLLWILPRYLSRELRGVKSDFD